MKLLLQNCNTGKVSIVPNEIYSMYSLNLNKLFMSSHIDTEYIYFRYNILKKTTEMQLQEANKMFNKMKDEHENELNRRNTKIKRQEIIINSLEHCLQQKCMENDKLSLVCDEFIYNQKRIF